MTPEIVNYSNELATYPTYDIIQGGISIKAGSTKLRLSGAAARSFANISIGDYLLCDVGDQTSELRKIVGFDRINRQVQIDSGFTVQTSDTTIRLVTLIEDVVVTVKNTGASVIYINGSSIPAEETITFPIKTTGNPIIVYGASTFTISNGLYNASSSGGGGNNYFPASW